MISSIRKLALALPLVVSLSGCMAEVAEPHDTFVDEAEQALLLPSNELEFEAFDDPAGIGSAGQSERKLLITSPNQYREVFGHAAPRGVDFTREMVIFYSAGLKRGDGHSASVERVLRTGLMLRIETRLESPASECIDPAQQSVPYTLVKLRAGGRALSNFSPTEQVTTPCDVPSCDDVTCDPGTHCELQDVVCVRAPCLPVPTCVADDAPFCGGIAAIPCPGEGTCVDHPSDGCDPARGGADCGGLCACTASGACEPGFVWNASPDVCACEPAPTPSPCAAVLCRPGTECVVTEGSATCVATLPLDPCATVRCATGLVCTAPADRPMCVRDPRSVP